MVFELNFIPSSNSEDRLVMCQCTPGQTEQAINLRHLKLLKFECKEKIRCMVGGRDCV
jgi:hypothetical protein